MKIRLLLLAFLPFVAVAQSRIYVNQSATGQNTGASWQDAFNNLQNAITASQPGDEIWVAQGLYKPTDSTDRWATFAPKSGTKFYGGFAGNESILEKRNWLTNPVILSGDIGVEGDSLDNCFNVMYLLEPDSFTLIDGFIFERGMAYPGNTSGSARTRDYCGGGLYISGQDGEAYPTIQNCIFRNNYARNCGGGVMVYGDHQGSSVSTKFINCKFENNTAFTYGAGVGRDACSLIERGIEFYQCDFIGNRCRAGGGLYIEDIYGRDTIDIIKCNFLKNQTTINGGGISFSTQRTGGLWINIDSCQVIENKSVKSSGIQLELYEFAALRRNLTISNSNFSNNVNLNGDFMIQVVMAGDSNSVIKLTNNVFEDYNTDNLAVLSFSMSGKFEASFNKIIGYTIPLRANDFKKCVFESDFFKRIATGPNPLILSTSFSSDIKNSVFVSEYSSIIGPANMLIQSETGDYVNNLFVTLVPVKLIVGSQTFNDSQKVIKNSIIKSPFSSVAYQTGYTGYKFEYCSLDQSWTNAPPNVVTYGPGNIFGIDPLFINPDSNDYHLQPCSPLINAGTNAVIQPGDTDLDGNTRIRGGTVDIGPYESAPLGLAAAPQTTGSCPGGSNGMVSFATDAACEPVLYNWSGPGGTSGTALEELAVGDYTITITDAKNDTLMATFSIPEGTSPQVVAQTTPVICGTTTGGTAMLDGTNGTAPFSFDWGNGVVDSMVTGLAYGVYPVTITDANGCTATANIQIGRMGNLQVQIIKNDVSCHNETDGSITIQPTNGAAPYDWLWQFNGSTAPDISDLAAGNYAGTMTDNLGCAINWIVPIENPDTIAANTEVTAATGPAIADGSILLVPSGGTGDFTAVWDNGTNGLFINNLLPGFYTATITDDNGCTQTITVEVPWSSGTGEAGVRDVRVWPNPSQEWVFVQPPAEFGTFIFYLTDVQGKVIRTLDRTDGSVFLIHTGDLPQGTYLWRMTGKNGSAGGKIVCIKQ